jgi:carbonic anhydrase
MSQTLLQQIREVNKSFLAGSPRFLDASGDHFIVVACMDPRLTGFIEPALGLPQNRALVIRIAGNQVSDANRDVVRSVAAGVFMKGAKEILIVGHTDCALSKFSAAEVIESFRKAGIPRSAFGDEDLRTWFGAFTDVKTNVLQSVEYLRKAIFVPRDLKIHGLIIGIERGELEIVLDGDVAPIEAAPAPAKPEEIAAAISSVAPGTSMAVPAMPPAPPESKSVKGPVKIGAVEKTAGAKPVPRQPDSMLEAAMVLRDFISRERQNAQFERTVAQIDNVLKSERDPIRIVAEMERIANNYRAKYPELPGALEYLKKAVRARDFSHLGFKELMRRMLE